MGDGRCEAAKYSPRVFFQGENHGKRLQPEQVILLKRLELGVQ